MKRRCAVNNTRLRPISTGGQAVGPTRRPRQCQCCPCSLSQDHDLLLDHHPRWRFKSAPPARDLLTERNLEWCRQAPHLEHPRIGVIEIEVPRVRHHTLEAPDSAYRSRHIGPLIRLLLSFNLSKRVRQKHATLQNIFNLTLPLVSVRQKFDHKSDVQIAERAGISRSLSVRRPALPEHPAHNALLRRAGDPSLSTSGETFYVPSPFLADAWPRQQGRRLLFSISYYIMACQNKLET